MHGNALTASVSLFAAPVVAAVVLGVPGSPLPALRKGELERVKPIDLRHHLMLIFSLW